ncbi:hypothetical protein AVI51_15660 (plasmid) [Piscirickettsia salmonis]|uniref:Uncharacterized protein n=1 Tax=Piscirickettsia salmonis TaxID=1238 RepID=A0A9Q5VBW9_PISSA|nr:DUF6880 family protein [Piscirickettsia salmonis]APS46093.1 hypothetical protein AVI48_16950 [Piscirickettsia salmonis]APS49145.1 hypothetical protein AVI49_15910 [Piscirickettsia salmonis]APS52397.1 hypothetical protein AVI50_16225 [Piscirickettsia salmonis]APS55548.1 hypothetical protein AVI51_15660 [Piscirickettsia salmonis]APS58933.1 hypothetical protein AVI52_17005 [Piscirickettsia salmonis]
MPKLNRETWSKKLEKISQDKLFDCILSYAEEDKFLKKKLDLLLVSLDPKKLAKNLKAEVNTIKRGKKFLEWREASGLAYQIDQIIAAVNKNLRGQAPELAAEVLELLITSDNVVFERADDSNGDLGGCYRYAVECWGKTWAQAEKIDQKKLAEKVFDVALENDYGVRDNTISKFKQALNKEGVDHLERLIKETLSKLKPPKEKEKLKKIGNIVFFDRADLSELKERGRHSHLKTALQEIADLRDSVDDYIDLLRQESPELHAYQIIEIAKRLIKAWRSKEAIDYLVSCDEPLHCQHEINKLLIEAYELEGLGKEAQKIRWHEFEQHLDAKSFQVYIKHCTAKEVGAAKENAIRLAKEQSLTISFEFLIEMGEVATVAEWVREEGEVRNVYYSPLRQLSNQLAKHECFLEAVLCRRMLVKGVLTKSQSKYYKYAVNDLKQAMKFAKEVKEWGDVSSQADYHAKLKEEHKRKSSLWQLVKEAGLRI